MIASRLVAKAVSSILDSLIDLEELISILVRALTLVK
jgi:hypothetical protein